MAVATDNCNNFNNNSCQTFSCNVDGNYDGKTGSPNELDAARRDCEDPRVINLFIVPYQASKGLTGQGDEIPVLGFASFYVMNWGGGTATRATPARTRPSTTTTTPARRRSRSPPPAGSDLGRLRRDGRLRARARRPDRDLRRGPAHAVPRHARPMTNL